ncbi:MAG: hypothetical protein ACRESB_22680, partial [Pseudomonas sp.]
PVDPVMAAVFYCVLQCFHSTGGAHDIGLAVVKTAAKTGIHFSSFCNNEDDAQASGTGFPRGS